MNPLQTRMDRRSMLKSSAALGVSALLSSSLLSACGSDSDSVDNSSELPTGTREPRSLHFDLSHAPIVEPRLQLFNSSSHNAVLKAHDADSRGRHRQRNPLLASVPDEKLTHYVEDVDAPADALQIVGVWGKHPRTGAPVLAGHFIHVPQSSLQAVEKKRASRGQPLRGVSAKLDHYGAAAPAVKDAPITSQIDFNSAPWDVAVWLVFQHPSIMNVNADLGADILDRINNLPCDPNDQSCDPYLTTLVTQIANMIAVGGYPTTVDTASWAMLDPYISPDTGVQVIDDDGNPVFMYKMNEALSDTVAAVVKQILNSITNDPAFAGTNYRVLDDTANATASAPAPTALAAAIASIGAEPTKFSVNSNFKINKKVNGIKVEKIDATDDRQISIQVRHFYLRTLGVYVEFVDSAGKSLPTANKGGIDTDTAKFVGCVMADNQIMGVPIMDDWLNPPEFIEFTMPEGAASANVHFGSLGLGGANPFSGLSKMGAISTLVLNMALPAAFLVYGIATTWQKNVTTTFQEAWKKAFDDPKLIEPIVKAVFEGGIRDGIQEATGKLTIKPFVAQVIKLAAGLVAKLIPVLAEISPLLITLLATSTAASNLAKGIPIFGQVLWALSTAGDVAAIGESFVEVMCSPALKTYTLSLTLPSSVRINRDPDDFEFPATATHYTVSANYGQGATPVVIKGLVPIGQVDPIDVPLKVTLDDGTKMDVASGGQVSVSVEFYSDAGCVVGQGSTDPIDNMPGAGGALVIPVTIKEMLVSLDKTTQYQHAKKLVYQGGRRSWSTTAPVPQLTRANLCQGNDGAICSLRGITVHTATGMAGYGFYAGGQGVGLCGGGSAASLNTIENVFLGNDPESGLKFSSCGSTQPIGIVYGARSQAVGGHNFFLQLGSDGFFHLRSVNLDGSAFDMAQTTSWGRFHSALDSLTVTDNGVVVGINRNTNKIEALGLPAAARDSDNNLDSATANFAVIQSGKGSTAGHLDTPVAVTSYGNTVLILEQANSRIQAFDTDGNTVSIFKDDAGNSTPLLNLPRETGTTISYLDIAAEARGYIYVLSCTGQGTTPSAYRLDLYAPDGSFVSRTTSIAASKIALDLFRNVYTLNYETMVGSPRVEPSLSQWLPHSTGACPTATAHAGGLFSRAKMAFAQCRSDALRLWA